MHRLPGAAFALPWVVVLIGAIAAGCGDDAGGGGVDAGDAGGETGQDSGGDLSDQGSDTAPDSRDVDDDTRLPSFRAGLSWSSVELVAGDAVEVQVLLTRLNFHDRVVTAELTSVPTGVSADTLTIDAVEIEGTLVVEAAEDAGQGTIEAIVEVSDGDLTFVLDLSIALRGRSGSLDRTFAVNGRVEQPHQEPAALTDMMVLDDGAMIVVGHETGIGIIQRWLPSGELDLDFGDLGEVLINEVNAEPPRFHEPMAVWADGDKITVVGNLVTPAETRYEPFVMRLTSDGAPDENFSGDGLVLPYGSVELDEVFHHVQSFTIDASNQDIFLTGWMGPAGENPYSQVLVFGLNGAGQPLPSFGTLGELILAPPGGNANGRSVAASGRALYVGGTVDTEESGIDLFVVKVGSDDGQPDAEFGTSGFLVGGEQWSDTLSRIVVQSVDEEDAVLVTGSLGRDELASDFFVSRLTSAGVVDESFNDGEGAFSIDLGDLADRGVDITFDAEGRIVLGAVAPLAGGSGLVSVIRLSADGVPDETFGEEGVAVASVASGESTEVAAIGVDPEGRYPVAGAMVRSDYKAWFLVRFWP